MQWSDKVTGCIYIYARMYDVYLDQAQTHIMQLHTAHGGHHSGQCLIADVDRHTYM